MAGRALRLFPNKSRAIIIDFGDVPHSLTASAELIADDISDVEAAQEEAHRKAILDRYPVLLNQRLRVAAAEMDHFF